MAHDPTAEGTDSPSEDESNLMDSSIISPTTEQSTTESDHDVGDDPPPVAGEDCVRPVPSRSIPHRS
ncbi:hypothetical protein [Halococcus thailandensis]|uniref:Uncharacterized protein n=1 Tax=Halococcus thailandensis JCM 13552 TaxID=1227457 RepID=M0NB63_9EURY|nr:hypothetical protein [Halococcus thailandensis]EMA54339.1 hypothetical protein C451_06680 [Halococcus thailandensis JCM 13552]